MSEQTLKIIRIISSGPLTADRSQQIAERFAARNKIDKYQVETLIDPALIGGIVIFAGGFRYDFSIRGQLDRIAGRLKKQQSIQLEGDFEEAVINRLIHSNLDEALADFTEMPIGSAEQNPFFAPVLADSQKLDEKNHLMVDSMREQLDALTAGASIDEVGEVVRYSDGVATVTGLQNCEYNELIYFSQNIYGIAMNLEEGYVDVLLLQQNEAITEGVICKRTGSTVHVPAGKPLLGRVVDPLGQPIDGLGPIETSQVRPIEFAALSISDRQPVDQSLHTGITAIDALTPIGRGQRELILGDRQTGKTAIIIDAIINQKDKGVFCVYVAIGQKMSTVAAVVNVLQEHDALSYTTVVVAEASTTASLQYIAPYAGCAMAEALLYENGADVLIAYDDLTKHAQAYRAISLLLRRPPGREAYPGDVFYLHARLLERSGQRNKKLGGGSITALPVVETQSGDISAYIPTNVISITDGQIYLENDLFVAGQRPAINVGLSVSRVGGAAQIKAMKKVAGPLRINLAQYRSLAAFSQFSSELDGDTKKQLMTGERLMEVLKQNQYAPVPVAQQVVMLYLANSGFLISLHKQSVQLFLQEFLRMLSLKRPQLLEPLKENGELPHSTWDEISRLASEYLPVWQMENNEHAAEN